jgi:TorA maturation chaperone TorD
MQTPPVDLRVNQLALARSNAYHLFSRLFQRGLTPALLPLVNTFPELAVALADPADTAAFDPDQLAADHSHLFGFNIFPYQSLFLDEASSLGGRVSEEVLEFYNRVGFSVLQGGECPDHIGLELAFLAFLSAGEADAWEDGQMPVAQRNRRWQRRFHDEHLLRWLPGLSRAVRQQGERFYTALADLTLQLALEHRKDLANDLPAPRQDFQLPPIPDEIKNEMPSLNGVALILLTPAYSGLYLSRDDISRLARPLNIPCGVGARQQMLTYLVQAAADDDRLPCLLESLQALVGAWSSFYTACKEGEPALAQISSVWLERLEGTRVLLGRPEVDAAS